MASGGDKDRYIHLSVGFEFIYLGFPEIDSVYIRPTSGNTLNAISLINLKRYRL